MTNQQQAQVAILRIYLKDLSFESPSAPVVFQQELNPEIKINLQVDHEKVGEDVYEVTLQLNAEAKKGDSTCFIVEIEQAGLFRIEGIPQDRMAHVLEVFCPNILFPYARQCIDNSLGLGSFPPLMLAPVNFEQIHMAKRAQGAPAH